MNDTQQYGLPASNSEVWLTPLAGVAYRAEAQPHHLELSPHKVSQKIQSQPHHTEQIIEVQAIEVQAIPIDATIQQPIEMQHLAYEVEIDQASSSPSQADQTDHPGLLDVGFWLSLPE